MRPLRAQVLGLLLGLLAQAADARDWLEVTSPPQARSTTSLPLLEVKGRAGSRTGAGHDLVIAIDLSDSTLVGCGVDLDGDGPGSRSDPAFIAELKRRGLFPPRLAVRLDRGLDFDDTVLAAELEAARSLVDRLDPRRFRVGLVVFSDDATTAARIGAPPSALGRSLAEIRFLAPGFLRGTNLMAAIEVAQAELAPEDQPRPTRRERSLVLLTDGAPTLPLRDGPGPRTVAAARAAGARGIRIFPFAIGPEARASAELLEEIARETGGRASGVDHPSEVSGRLRMLDLVDLAGVKIANLTTGEGARALRTFPDGSFDGFLPLVAGTNRIRVEAIHVDGSRHAVERWVVLEPSGAAGPDQERLRQRMEDLRSRTRELEAWARMEDRRRKQLKALEIDAEQPTPEPGEGGGS